MEGCHHSNLAEDLLSEEQHAEYDAVANREIQRVKRLAQTPHIHRVLLSSHHHRPFFWGVSSTLRIRHITGSLTRISTKPARQRNLTLAWKRGSYREVRDIPELHHQGPIDHLASCRPAILRQAKERPSYISDAGAGVAWLGEYHGDYQKAMLKNINSMERGLGHASLANVIISYGRRDREVTIPFNTRNPSDRPPLALKTDAENHFTR